MTARGTLRIAGAIAGVALASNGCFDERGALVWDPDAVPVGPTDPAWPHPVPLAAPFDLGPWLTAPDEATVAVGWRTIEPTTGWLELIVSRDGSLGVDWDAAERHDDLGETTAHEIRLTGLFGSTAYRYRVHAGDDADAVREGVFVTAGAEPWRFVHLAEIHAASERANVARFADAIVGFRPHLAIESGDMVDTGDELDDWRGYFAASAPWISNVILVPVHSNHVNGTGGSALFRDLFALPDNERWYTTRYGSVEVVSLDSTFEANPDAETEDGWIRDRLAEDLATADPPRHVIGAWHYPACSSLYRERTDQRRWVIDRLVGALATVDEFELALVGHDKYYERSRLSVGGREIAHVMGNLGRLAPGTPGGNEPECTTLVTHSGSRSLGEYVVEGDAIRARVVDDAGDDLDRFEIGP